MGTDRQTGDLMSLPFIPYGKECYKHNSRLHI